MTQNEIQQYYGLNSPWKNASLVISRGREFCRDFRYIWSWFYLIYYYFLFELYLNSETVKIQGIKFSLHAISKPWR